MHSSADFQRGRMKFSRRREGGFSLLELIIVLVVILIVSALAVPNMMNILYNIRLRSSAQTLAGMMQTCRSMSIRDNKFYYVRHGSVNDATVVWVSDSNISTAPAVGEPQAQLGSGVVFSTTGNPSDPPLDFDNPYKNLAPAFNSRGLPCRVLGGRCVTLIPGLGNRVVSFELYLTDNRPVGTNGWATVTISPSSRVQVFLYNGSTWGS